MSFETSWHVHIQITLKGFRSGKFMTLVATNVAARGLDINDVQLIIQVCLCFLIAPRCTVCSKLCLEDYKFILLVLTIVLLFQCEPPRDVEAYIHRTGRAGNWPVVGTFYPSLPFVVLAFEYWKFWLLISDLSILLLYCRKYGCCCHVIRSKTVQFLKDTERILCEI